MIYIIEHLEPKLWEWCILEYEHISQTVGKDNLWFTNIRDKEEGFPSFVDLPTVERLQQ